MGSSFPIAMIGTSSPPPSLPVRPAWSRPNLADFSVAAVPAGIGVVDPDAFALSLFNADPEAVVAVIDEQAAALRNPPMTTSELLDGLEVVGLHRLVDSVRSA